MSPERSYGTLRKGRATEEELELNSRSMKQKMDPDHGKAWPRSAQSNKGVQSGDRVFISSGDRCEKNCRQKRDRARGTEAQIFALKTRSVEERVLVQRWRPGTLT
ncbi:hypothetical protein AOLI_G00301430 [Acnodon oligacanthus]